ncbi:X-ray repair cross-complementing protein [Trichinella spiralis]|uniref:X-ray repair cross-complementing protein n=1 Tax=Trichinella spiralis TaxID=6334 RepID=A0ABR3KMP0_TRISP
MGFRTEKKTGTTAFAWYDSRMVTMTSAYILMSIQCIKDDDKTEGNLNNIQSGLYGVDYLYLISENSSAHQQDIGLFGEIQEQQLRAVIDQSHCFLSIAFCKKECRQRDGRVSKYLICGRAIILAF